MSIARFACVALVAVTLCGCRRAAAPEPPVATPSVVINHPRAPLGSPIDITYRFVVAQNAPPFKENYRVFAGVVDADEELMWSDDHDPQIPTTQWKPGQIVEYTRTVFVPIYPYIGEASIHMGLYSTSGPGRLPLSGEDVGQRAYQVAKIQLLPQTENVFTIFKEGWHPAEVADQNASVEWQWTKKHAVLSFRNPKKDSLFYLDADNPSSAFPSGQHVEITVGGQTIDQFDLQPQHPVLRKVPITAAQLGTAEMIDLEIDVDKTFVPAQIDAAAVKDPRELGVRVFHAFVDPR